MLHLASTLNTSLPWGSMGMEYPTRRTNPWRCCPGISFQILVEKGFLFFGHSLLIFEDKTRLLFGAVEKEVCCKCGCSGRHTLEGMLQIFCWSMECLLRGEYPTARHDGSPWASTDKQRQKRTGKLPCKAGLLQIRGDWAWYKQASDLTIKTIHQP